MQLYPFLQSLQLRQFTPTGEYLAGGLVYAFEMGTSTPLATFQDPAGEAFNTNPIQLNDEGSASIYLQNKSYTFQIYSFEGQHLYTSNIPALSSTGGVIVVENYEELRNLDGLPDMVFVKGRETPYDGGTGWFSLDSTSDATDDSGVVLINKNVNRYKRQMYGYIDGRWFGLTYSSPSSQNEFLQSANDASIEYNLPLKIEGLVRLSSNFTFTSEVIFTPGSSLATSLGTPITVTFENVTTLSSEVFTSNIVPIFEANSVQDIKTSYYALTGFTNSIIGRILQNTDLNTKLYIDSNLTLDGTVDIPDNFEVIFGINGKLNVPQDGFDILIAKVNAPSSTVIEYATANYINNLYFGGLICDPDWFGIYGTHAAIVTGKVLIREHRILSSNILRNDVDLVIYGPDVSPELMMTEPSIDTPALIINNNVQMYIKSFQMYNVKFVNKGFVGTSNAQSGPSFFNNCSIYYTGGYISPCMNFVYDFTYYDNCKVYFVQTTCKGNVILKDTYIESGVPNYGGRFPFEGRINSAINSAIMFFEGMATNGLNSLGSDKFVNTTFDLESGCIYAIGTLYFDSSDLKISTTSPTFLFQFTGIVNIINSKIDSDSILVYSEDENTTVSIRNSIVVKGNSKVYSNGIAKIYIANCVDGSNNRLKYGIGVTRIDDIDIDDSNISIPFSANIGEYYIGTKDSGILTDPWAKTGWYCNDGETSLISFDHENKEIVTTAEINSGSTTSPTAIRYIGRGTNDFDGALSGIFSNGGEVILEYTIPNTIDVTSDMYIDIFLGRPEFRINNTPLNQNFFVGDNKQVAVTKSGGIKIKKRFLIWAPLHPTLVYNAVLDAQPVYNVYGDVCTNYRPGWIKNVESYIVLVCRQIPIGTRIKVSYKPVFPKNKQIYEDLYYNANETFLSDGYQPGLPIINKIYDSSTYRSDKYLSTLDKKRGTYQSTTY